MTEEVSHEELELQGPVAPLWAQRLRDLGIHISYALQGWDNVPRPQPRIIVGVAGGIWTIFEGPPEFLGDLLSILGVDGD